VRGSKEPQIAHVCPSRDWGQANLLLWRQNVLHTTEKSSVEVKIYPVRLSKV
jgi:hypothetical protein